MLIGIALLLGIGIAFDTVVSAGAYTYLPEKKINRYLKSLGIEEI